MSRRPLIPLVVALGAVTALVWMDRRGASDPAAARAPAASPSSPRAVVRTPAPPLRVQPVVRDEDDGFGEPVIDHGRFAGWPKSQWRDWYGERLTRMTGELDEARRTLEQVERGELSPADDEIGNLRMRVKDLTLRIAFDRGDLDEVERERP